LVVWHSPDKAEGLAYLKHVQAKANGKPLAFRKGGAKALGIRVPFEQNFASAALARQQLQNDVPISAQWIQVQDAKEAQRLLDLARVYDCKAKVGVVFQGPTDKHEICLCQQHRPKGCCHLACHSTHGFWVA
jgi:hypothetical protein